MQSRSSANLYTNTVNAVDKYQVVFICILNELLVMKYLYGIMMLHCFILRFLLPTALLDQDLFYLETKPNLQHQKTPQPDSTLVMGMLSMH